jgi:hypothetical protein
MFKRNKKANKEEAAATVSFTGLRRISDSPGKMGFDSQIRD